MIILCYTIVTFGSGLLELGVAEKNSAPSRRTRYPLLFESFRGLLWYLKAMRSLLTLRSQTMALLRPILA
jgi:hypothetical protein